MSKALVLAETIDNLGDLALTLQLADGLKAHCGVEDIAVQQWNLPSSPMVAQAAGHGLRVRPGKSPAALLEPGRAVVFGGGQVVRGNKSAASMLALLMQLVFARLRGDARLALAIGIGPCESRLRRVLWRLILSNLQLITVRDAVSLHRAGELCGTGRPVMLTADLAFARGPLHRLLEAPAAGQPAGILIAPCHDPGEHRVLDAEAVASLAFEAAAAAGERRVRIVLHDGRPGMDARFAARLEAVLRARGFEDVAVVADGVLQTLLGHYRSARCVLTNRLHAAVFALLARRPVVIIDDGNDKLSSMARSFAIPLLAQDARPSTETLERLRGELFQGGSRDRELALDQARGLADENFALAAPFVGTLQGRRALC